MPALNAILDLIAEAEGTERGRGYDEVIGFGKFGDPPLPVTQMTLTEIYQYQKDVVNAGAPSGAVGRYQFINAKKFPTLSSTAEALGYDPDTTYFTPEIQDEFAIYRMEERGLSSWLSGKKSTNSFINGLSYEWASIPNTAGRSSHKQRVGADLSTVRATLKNVRVATPVENIAQKTGAMSWKTLITPETYAPPPLPRPRPENSARAQTQILPPGMAPPKAGEPASWLTPKTGTTLRPPAPLVLPELPGMVRNDPAQRTPWMTPNGQANWARPSLVTTLAKQEVTPLPRPRPTSAPSGSGTSAINNEIGNAFKQITAATNGMTTFYDSVVNAQRAISGLSTSSATSDIGHKVTFRDVEGFNEQPISVTTIPRRDPSSSGTTTRASWGSPSGLVTVPKSTPTAGWVTTPATTRTVTRTVEVDNPEYQVYLGQLANNQRMTPTGAVITADQFRALNDPNYKPPQRPAPLVAPPKKIKRVITEVVQVPAQKKKAAGQQPSSSSNPAPAPATFRGTATGNNYVVGQTYKSADGKRTLRANADGTFTNITTGQTSKGSSGRSGSVSSNPPINQVSGSSTSSSGVGGTTRSMESSSRWTTGY
jgi:muramidase (phage lysozyme)